VTRSWYLNFLLLDALSSQFLFTLKLFLPGKFIAMQFLVCE